MPQERVTILDTEPRLLQASDGSWLAVSGVGLGIGTFGATPENARLRFKASLAHRAELLRKEPG